MEMDGGLAEPDRDKAVYQTVPRSVLVKKITLITNHFV
jgi:hypothetical protein